MSANPYVKRIDAEQAQARQKIERTTGRNLHDMASIVLGRYDTGTNDGLEVVCMADVTMRPVHWLWQDWLAAGKLHVLAGAPGTGKTTIALSLAATVSTGGRWPDGTRCNDGQLSNVLIWSGEDDPADTIRPRLAAAGADLKRIYYINGMRIAGEEHLFDPAYHLAELAVKVDEIGNIGLLIVDPIVSAVAGDSHKNSEVRRALEPLVTLGQSYQCAILGISGLDFHQFRADLPRSEFTNQLVPAQFPPLHLDTLHLTDVDEVNPFDHQVGDPVAFDREQLIPDVVEPPHCHDCGGLVDLSAVALNVANHRGNGFRAGQHRADLGDHGCLNLRCGQALVALARRAEAAFGLGHE